MRLSVLLAAALLTAALATAPSARAGSQETEAPSSKPLPSPGAPPPPLAAPPQESAAGSRPDRRAARAAVRDQCVADRARFCRDASTEGEDACLAARFSRLSPDCQSAITALRQARDELSGAAPR